MRRYSLKISGRDFVIDVQELSNDRFEVQVGGESYEVTLSGDESLSEAVITPGFQAGAASRPASMAMSSPATTRQPSAATPVPAPVARKPAGSGGKNAITAPMPGVILELSVKPGDTLKRGQQVAILDAMKMHNVIGSPRDATVAEVCVAVGQSVDHGDVIIRFQEG